VPPPSLCLPGLINNEPEILVGYLPGPGQSVSVNGQIKVWLSDEAPAFISSGEVVDPTTGAITTPGDRTAKAPDGYLWEPALYVTPASGGTTSGAYFPVTIKGWYNNSPPLSYVAGKQVPGIEPFPTPPLVTEIFSTELIWDVGSMGLAPGDYTAEFVVHDGDTDRGVGCVNITIAPAAK
jgi:hypothetical protein